MFWGGSVTLHMEAGAHTDGFDQISPEACNLPECSLETLLLLKQVHRLCGSRSPEGAFTRGCGREVTSACTDSSPRRRCRARAAGPVPRKGHPPSAKGDLLVRGWDAAPPLSQMHGPAASAFRRTAGRQRSGALHARVHPRLRGACPARPAQRPPVAVGVCGRGAALRPLLPQRLLSGSVTRHSNPSAPGAGPRRVTGVPTSRAPQPHLSAP